MKRLCILIAFVCAFYTACSQVTETGNPCPTEGCTEAATQGGQNYENSTYHVRMDYPASWSAEEPAGGEPQGGCDDCMPAQGSRTPDVTFSNGGAPPTSVEVYFEAISGAYTTLSVYLQALYPSYSFSQYDTATLTGYLYDDPSAGENGGDMREYFFSNGSVLITLTAEVFESGEADMETLLNGISFF